MVTLKQVQESQKTAANTCLSAACASLNLEIGEIWHFMPHPAAPSGRAPACMHVYAQPETLENYRSKLVGIWEHGERDRTHKLSPGLCERAHESECPLWFTGADQDGPLHADLPLTTAIVLPIRLDSNNSLENSFCVVYFSTYEVQRQRSALDFLIHVSKAAVLAMADSFSEIAATLPNALEGEEMGTDFHDVKVIMHPGEVKVDLNVPWSSLSEIEFLVSGSRCSIYTATFKDQPVVVKVLRKDSRDVDAVMIELETEMKFLTRCHHPNIVKLLGAGTEPERFLIIERLDGGTLAQRCGGTPGVRDNRHRFRRKQPFHLLEILRYGRQLADAMHYLNDEAIPGKLIIHRDIKPDNIGFSLSGDLKLLDLGLARTVARSNMEDNPTYEMTGETGSTRYMAPEVAESRPYSEKADVYSFAMVMWEMATLRKPYEGLGRDQFYAEVVRGNTRPHLSKKWPKEFSSLLKSCWDEDPKNRPSFSDIASTLQEMIQEMAVHPPPRADSRRGLFSKLGLHDRGSAWF